MLTQYVSPDDFDYHILVHSVLVIHVLNHTQIIVYKIANVSIQNISEPKKIKNFGARKSQPKGVNR